tara:strand:- start:3483 stop:4415 length:933 start_codon:yes stop_codon:yes gene_type:complete
MKTKISIVIRCLNENNNLKILIPLLQEQTLKNYEIIFVDSGSTDGTLETIKNFINISSNVQLTHIKKEEFTFGRSLNIGFSKALGEIVISLSAHCFPTSEEWLKNIIQPFSNSNIGIVFGKQSPHENTRFSEASVQKKWFAGESMVREDIFLNNGNAAYRKSLWEEIKFDETLTGLEDINFGLYAKSKGWGLYYSNESDVQHLHNENYKTIRNRYRREAEALKIIFDKHKIYSSKYNLKFYNLTLIACVQGFFRGVIFDIRKKRNSKLPYNNLTDILKYRYNQFYGTYKGFNKTIDKNKMTEMYFYPPKI